MTKLTSQKIQEIYSRFENPSDWLDAEPFWKGMFWSATGGRKAEPDRYGPRPDIRNLLVISLPARTRRSDVIAAIDINPAAEGELRFLEKAFDEAGIEFFDEKSIFDDRQEVSLVYAHGYLQECIRPPAAGELQRLIQVANRLIQVASVELQGVILVVTDGRYREQSFHVQYDKEGAYRLSPLQKEGVESETDNYFRTQSYRFRALVTPSPFDAAYNHFADPAHANIGRGNNTGSLEVAAIAADMGVHGVSAAILQTLTGREYVLKLGERRTIRQTEKAILALVPSPRDLSIIRAIPGLRTRHRFFIVAGRIVADTPFSSSGGSETITTGSYRLKTGPAEVQSMLLPDQGEKAIMRPFAEKVLEALCEHRPHWIIDVELSEQGPLLASISDILDVQWFSADEVVMPALQAYQASNFKESDLELEQGGSSSRPKKARVESKRGRVVNPMEEDFELDASESDASDFLADLLSDEED
jgi:hypothetical protein